MSAVDPFSDPLATATLLQSYAPLPGVFDELMTSDRQIRAHWQSFINDIHGMSATELESRLRLTARVLTENGRPHAISGPADGAERPWDLDFVPLLLSQDDWNTIAEGLIQRAQLLNEILVDLYGPQRLLHEGHIPAALVFANRHFLRPCHNMNVHDRVWLHFYAADLGRGPDGRWWILADRAQAPAGIGYALENRIAMSRGMPEFFRHRHVHRLASFFRSMHLGLLARTQQGDPRIVLLTNRSNVDSYFDHAYLARYLGYTLAEGADLTVRNDRVYLKTVDGLKPVDLILRGIDSEYCDPLEMQADHREIGIPGLAQAARTGSVTVANALGSGLVESKALMGFMPVLSRILLGEELRLPSTASWWCGEDSARQYALANLDDLAIEQAFERRPLLAEGRSRGPVLGSALTQADRAAVRDRLMTRGHDYVAQELVSLSTTPEWAHGELKPRPMSLRVFVAASEDGYLVMPGGLTRVSETLDPRAAVLRRGKESKDTLVLSDKPVASFSLLPTSQTAQVPRRRSKDIPSHSADNLFWLGRYAERGEGILRALKSVLRRMIEETGVEEHVRAITRIVATLIEKTEITPPSKEEQCKEPTKALERQIYALMYDLDKPYTLQDTLQHLDRTAALARDWLSVEAWRILRRFHIDATYPPLGDILDVGEALEKADNGILTLAAFSGMENENMTRDFGWQFLDMGRRLERALHLAKVMHRLLVSGEPEQDGSLALLLELADSRMTYQWRYLATPMLAPVIDLVLLDETNPRSVAFQIALLDQHVENLPRDIVPPDRSAEQRIMLSLLTRIRLAEIQQLCHQDTSSRRGELATLLGEVETALPKLSEAITRSYFSHTEARRPADLMRVGEEA